MKMSDVHLMRQASVYFLREVRGLGYSEDVSWDRLRRLTSQLLERDAFTAQEILAAADRYHGQ